MTNGNKFKSWWESPKSLLIQPDKTSVCSGALGSPPARPVSCSSQVQAASSCTWRHSSTVHSPAMQAPVAKSWGNHCESFCRMQNVCHMDASGEKTHLQLLYSVVLVFAVQQSESGISKHISPPSWTALPPCPPHPSRLSQIIKLSSVRYTAPSN